MITAIQTMEIGTFPNSIQTTTSTTSFGSVLGINQNNFASLQSCFVFNKLPQLVKTPIIEPISLFFTDPASPNSFDIFHNNIISYITRRYNCFADFVVALSHKTFLSARNLFKEFSGAWSAFRLQPAPQISEFRFDIFSSLGIKKLFVGSNCNIADSNIYPLKPVRIFRRSNVSGKRNMQKHPIKFI